MSSAARRRVAVTPRYGPTTAQVILAWTLHRGAHVLAIPGTGRLDHVVANIAAGALALASDDLARLDEYHRGTATT